MLERLERFSKAVKSLRQGEKIGPEQENESFRLDLLTLLGQMHAGHFITAEPQCYVCDDLYRNIDEKYMGVTRLHPVPVALLEEANALREAVIRQDAPIAPFFVAGLNPRNSLEADSRDPGKAAVLTRGDIVALDEALDLILNRLKNPDVRYMAPVIVQDTAHFWDKVFAAGGLRNRQIKVDLERLNIHFTSGAQETVSLLAVLPFSRRIDPATVTFKFPGLGLGTDPRIAFGTTDDIKHSHVLATQKDLGVSGIVPKLISVIGPYASSAEEAYSYAGNAEAEKLREIYNILRKMGHDKARYYFEDHGFDISRDLLMTNDGGLGFCLENEQGERRIDLFTEKHFPDSMHKLSPMQMGPGVELAYLKRTDGLEITMSRLFGRVREILASDTRFRRGDLKAYDTSLFAAVPLSRVFAFLKADRAYDANELGVVAVSAAQTLAVVETPEFPQGSVSQVPETDNYLVDPYSGQVRALTPDWFLKAPNGEAFRLLRQVVGVAGTAPVLEKERRKTKETPRLRENMGLLGSVDSILRPRASEQLGEVMFRLDRDFNIATRQGPDVWRAYKEDQGNVLQSAQAGTPANGHYLSGMRRLLDRSRILLYANPGKDPLSDCEKVRAYLLLVKAVVRNQVFNRTEIVALRQDAAEILDLLAHKQMLGLVTQKTDSLLRVAADPQDAARIIADTVRVGQEKARPVERRFYSDGQAQWQGCLVMTLYASATNCNKTLQNQVGRTCYLAALNGFTLKIGGGNQGLMKAGADGFLKGKAELRAKGYDFPNQLVLIQCADTEAIELPYRPEGISGIEDGDWIYRCHPHIESRKLDLHTNDIPIAAAGGFGSDEEILSELLARCDGLIDPDTHPLMFFNQQMESPKGTVGVYDPYRRIFSGEFLREMNVRWAITPEAVIDHACTHRLHLAARGEQRVSLTSLREALAYAAAGQSSQALTTGVFHPPYKIFLGREGELPPLGRQSAPLLKKA